MGAVIEALGAGRCLVELGGQTRAFMHEALGIDLHAVLLAQAGIKVAHRQVQARQGTVEACAGRCQPVFKIRLTHCYYGPYLRREIESACEHSVHDDSSPDRVPHCPPLCNRKHRQHH